MSIKKIIKIFIIESPSSADILDDRKEGYALSEILRLAEINNTYFNVSDVETFRIALHRISIGIKNDAQKFGRHLHLSMHGNKSGIQLSNKEFLDWNKLYTIIKEFNDSNGYLRNEQFGTWPSLGINLSVCEGFNAKSIKKMGDLPPYETLIGPIEAVNWSDSLLSFATYYHNLVHLGVGTRVAVERMNAVCGLKNIFQIDLMDGLELA